MLNSIGLRRVVIGRAAFLLLAGPSLMLRPTPMRAQSRSAAAGVDDALDTFIRNEARRRHLPGLAVAVIRRGKVIKAKGYGLANVELAVPASDSTVYQIASLTKLFTATAVMKLTEEGMLSIEDHVSRFISDLPAAWSEITVRQLLDHTSGIRNYTETEPYTSGGPRDRTPREILSLVSALPLDFTPGEKFNYSNTGYILLGLLIERVTGKTYGDVLAEQQFRPLGMTRTAVNDPHAIVSNRAQSYVWKERTLRNADSFFPNAAFAAGALISTVSDLARWDVGLTDNRVLKRETLEQMWTAKYPLGWEVRQRNGHRTIVHAGDIAGFTSQYTRFEDDKLSVIVLINGSGLLTNAERIAGRIADQVEPSLARREEVAISDPDPASTARFARLVQSTFIDGIADLELFNDTMRQRTTPEMLRSSRAQLGMNGRLERLELLERRETETGLHLRYRADFEAERGATVFVDVDKTGKVSGLGIRSPPD